MTAGESSFSILWRVFLEQFAANESATSDLQMRRAIIGVFAFLITPGLFLMLKTMPDYELMLMVAKARNMPQLIETRLAQLAVIFVVYSMVTIGLITVFIWDTLVFDKRDAMVLGPLPLRGTTVVAAKLAALATLLLGAAFAVNVISGIPFAFVTGGPEGRILQHLAGHLAGTIGGAVFVFSTLVVIRGLLVIVCSPQFAANVGSLMQFAFTSAVLCFMMVPTAMGDTRPVFLGPGADEWMPMAWFFGLFETLRGSHEPGVDVLARRALIAAPAAVAAAILVTFGGYWRQMRAALAPPSRVSGSAWIRRGIARMVTGRDSIAQGTSDFILTTLARSRPQQVPIAICAAIGVAIISIAASSRVGSLVMLQSPRTVVLWIPLVIGYWMLVGLRASFFMPIELPAAWAFRAHAQLPSSSYWSGVRAAATAFVIGPALAVNALVVLPLFGWKIAAWHSAIVCIALVVAVEVMCLLTDSVPFTRAYPPGRAKLKTRWPLYLLGMYATAYWPVQLELRRLGSLSGSLKLAAAGIVLIAALEIIGRRTALRWQIQPEAEPSDDPEALTILNLGQIEPRALPNS
jgi:hypothetical protein